ncbi:MAG: ribosome maturation factor RimP [Candidatus Omnitrophica bacterium]|nr:ribosome maturation factor RimP [Candidatus Omnitrophota bacterium]
MEDPRAAAVRQLAEPLVSEQALELVELSVLSQGGQALVRLLVDAPGGVTLQQCARLNQDIGRALEAANVFEERHTVEVSSPGLDRPLVSRRDYERALGEPVAMSVARDDGRTTDVHGVVLAVQPDPEAVVVKTAGGNLTVPLGQIRWAKKALRW